MSVQIQGDTGNVIATRGTYSGNVTIGGTLTYEDVTNVDSVGLITARAGVKVGSGITLSSDGDVFTTGITTVGNAEIGNAVGGKIILGGDDTQFQVFAGSHVGLTTFVYGDTQVGSAVTDIARFELSNKTNSGLAMAMDDDSNISYIRHRDNGGNLGFMMRQGAQNRERVRIQSNGNVGIGISNPDTLLHLKVEEQTAKLITLNGDDSRNNYIGINGGDNLEIAADEDDAGSSSSIRFRIDGDEVLRMNADKRISVNTTTKYGMIHSLEDQFTPNDDRWLTDASYVASGSYGGGYVLLDGSKGYSMYCAQSGSDFYIRHHSSTTAAASGGVYINNGGTSWDSASDERDKENFVTISDAITKIKTLRTVTGNYTWQPDERHAFLIAQDVQAVLPEAVSVMNKDAATEDQRLSLRYTEVIPLLVKAMQEQQEEIESLKARLDAAGL